MAGKPGRKKGTYFFKILHHPDKEEIISRLNNGETPASIAYLIKLKHPRSKKTHLSEVLLQNFRKKYLQLDGEVLKDLQKLNREGKRKIEEELLLKQVQNTNAYQEKLNETADKYLDVSKHIFQLNSIVEERIATWYNMLKGGDTLPTKADQEMRKYIDQQLEILKQYKKLVEGMADKSIDYNINVNILNDQINIIRDVIREILSELGTEYSMMFMDKLNKRLTQAVYRTNELDKPTFDIKELHTIEAKLLSNGE